MPRRICGRCCSTVSGHDQYFFRDQRAMVHGVVLPPAIDLSNQELVQSHLNAIWLASTDVALEPGIADSLDLASAGRPVKAAIRDALANPEIATRAAVRIRSISSDIMILPSKTRGS
jgi:hypothetical protein